MVRNKDILVSTITPSGTCFHVAYSKVNPITPHYLLMSFRKTHPSAVHYQSIVTYPRPSRGYITVNIDNHSLPQFSSQSDDTIKFN